MDDDAPNDRFLQGSSAACEELGVKLTVLSPGQHRGDRWIQDEVEFGYSEAPTHVLPAVFDSPRDRQLDAFPERSLLAADFGHLQIGGSTPSSLDSFGNLEVSPPVTVRGRHYPFGRIVFGRRAYGDYGPNTRLMMPTLRQFFYAQKVQSPIEIFTDWLAIGHVDEIFTFVPADNDKGFLLLAASPRRARAILMRLREQGHGKVKLFEGLRREGPRSRYSAEITVDGGRPQWIPGRARLAGSPHAP